MPLRDLLGQDRALGQIRAALQRGRVHHAYLISGILGADVEDAGARFAEALLCPEDPEGCGVCSTCERARRGLHPDFLTAKLDAGAKDVRVEAIRDLCGALQLKPSESTRKVALISDADRMSPSAQNALLKTLEEPPPRTVLILTAESEDRLLPTIRSRCLRIRLGPLSEAMLVERLTKVDSATSEDLALVARQARGSLARAEGLLSRTGGGFRERRAAVIDHLEALLKEWGKGGAALASLELAEAAAEGREQAVETLEIVASCLRDILLVRGGAAPKWILSPDRVRVLAGLAEPRSSAQLFASLDEVAQASLALEGTSSPRLQVESVALQIGGVA